MKNSSEWDTEANYGVAAEMMPATAECVVHWRCAKCGRRYRARVCDHEAAAQAEGKELPGAAAGKAREAGKAGEAGKAAAGACPYCSGKLKYVKDSLEAERPDLADEFAEATNAKDLTLEATGELTAEGVRVNDARSFWWKCKVCGYMWKATIQERIAKNEGCFECATLVSHTSFPQLIIYHYLKEMFPDAVHRMRLDGNREIDVCVPSIHLAVEYDGDYYHTTKASCRKDLQKNKLMTEAGYRVVRFREEGCWPMQQGAGKAGGCELISFPNPNGDSIEFQNALQKFLDSLRSQCKGLPKVTVCIEKIRAEVNEGLYRMSYERSLEAFLKAQKAAGTETNLEWDYERNWPLTPRDVSYSNSRKVHWICRNDPSHRWYKTVNEVACGNGCGKCWSGYKPSGEEWIERARKVHGDRYDYSKVRYVNAHTKVVIICPIHGEFEQTPNNHLTGNGCPKCGKAEIWRKRKSSEL